MTIRFSTPFPAYEKELREVADIFLSMPTVPQEGDLQIVHTQRESNGARHCAITLEGALVARQESVQPIVWDPVMNKRLHKRQVKLLLYHALKLATGLRPPWGALTGIRPTRLAYEALDELGSLSHACRYLVDTFDVQPQKAELVRDIILTQQGLPATRERDVDIYVGVPFCPSRCRYCSFISTQVGDGQMLEPYTQALLREIDGINKLVTTLGLTPRAFYMGGGTPTALSAQQLRRVLAAAAPLMHSARESTVEAGRPDSLDEEKLRVILDAGARRISINPQTSFDTTLRTIGRNHTRAQTEAAYAQARRLGFRHINMDIIAGLPGEDLRMFDATLAWVSDMSPENLTIHTLCIKRSSDMHRLQDTLPHAAHVAEMVHNGSKTAQYLGMVPYYLYRQKHMAGNQENVGYALPGTECLYNVDTMEDSLSVLAAGAGGISKRVTKGRVMVYRAPNVKEVSLYIQRVDEMLSRKQALWQDYPG